MAYFRLDNAAQPIGNDGIGTDLGPTEVPGYVTWRARPYPTRFHGGIWTRPAFSLPTVRVPTAVFTSTNLNGCGCVTASGDVPQSGSMLRAAAYAAAATAAIGVVAWMLRRTL